MAVEFVKIAKIGDKIRSNYTSRSVKLFQDEFFYGNESFKLCMEIDILKVIKGLYK